MPPVRGSGLAEALMEALALIISSPIALALDIGLAEAEALDMGLALAEAEDIGLALADALALIMSSSIIMSSPIMLWLSASAAGANTSAANEANRTKRTNLLIFPPYLRLPSGVIR